MLRAGVVLGAGAVAARAGGVGAAAATTTFSDDFSAVRDGPLDGRVSRSGHRWISIGASGDPPMVVYGHAIGPPAGHVPGQSSGPNDTNPNAAAGYGIVDLGAPATSISASFRWDRSSSANTSLAFGAFDRPGVTDTLGSRAHLAVNPAFLQFAVFSGGVGDFTVLTPRGGSSGTVTFKTPQARDGRTTYRAYITISGDTARIDMDGLGPPVTYQDPRIASVAARYPFYEYYSVAGGTNLPRFVQVGAGR